MVITIEQDGSNIQVVYHDQIVTVPFKHYLYAKTQDVDAKYVSIFGDKLKKIEFDNPKEVWQNKDNYISYEADVKYTNRFLTDYFDVIPKEELQKCYIDIEIEMKGDFPDIMQPEQKVQSISFYDTKIQKLITFVLNNVVKCNVDKQNDIYYFDEEIKLFKAFEMYIKQFKPDVFTGWNSNGFDMPYIINRMKMLNLNINTLSKLNYVWCFKNEYGVKLGIKGHVALDLMEAYKYISQGERESYSLEYISQYELGEGKEKFDGNLQELYNQDIKKYVSYNRQDVMLLKKLDEKLRIIDFVDTMRRYARCNWSDVYISSKLTDAIFLKFSKGRFALPNQKWERTEGIKGAFVVSPKSGMYKNIAVFDWKSLYPNIIRTFNLSPERKLKNYQDGCITVRNQLISTMYFSQELGFISEVVGSILQEREYYNKEKKKYQYGTIEYKANDVLQYAVKVAANTIFGVLKSDCRLADSNIAEAITTMGQTIIKKAMEIVTNNGFAVIYGDTDSIFVDMRDSNVETFEALANTITKEICEWVKTEFNCKQSYLLLQFEKIFKSLIFVGTEGEDAAKKRYAGHITWKDGKQIDEINIMGFEAKRSDSPKLIREFQTQLFDKVLRNADKSDVDKFVEEFKLNFFTKREEIGIPVGIAKSEYTKNMPIHVRAATLSNKRHGTHFGAGDKIKFVYVKRQPKEFMEFENVIAFKSKIPDGYEIDYDKMYERLVQKKIDSVYETMRWTSTMRVSKWW